MKKLLKLAAVLCTALMLGAGLLACSSDDDDDSPVVQTPSNTDNPGGENNGDNGDNNEEQLKGKEGESGNTRLCVGICDSMDGILQFYQGATRNSNLSMEKLKSAFGWNDNRTTFTEGPWLCVLCPTSENTTTFSSDTTPQWTYQYRIITTEIGGSIGEWKDCDKVTDELKTLKGNSDKIYAWTCYIGSQYLKKLDSSGGYNNDGNPTLGIENLPKDTMVQVKVTLKGKVGENGSATDVDLEAITPVYTCKEECGTDQDKTRGGSSN